MKKTLLIGAIVVLATWIYTGGAEQFSGEVGRTAASKTEVFN